MRDDIVNDSGASLDDDSADLAGVETDEAEQVHPEETPQVT